MENATEALMMAFGMLMFVIAITITMSLFNQARATSDYIIFQKDKNNFIEAEEFNDTLINIVSDPNFDYSQRVVGIETIVPALFKCYKENYRVVFLKNDLTPLSVYESTWLSAHDGVLAYKNKYGFLDNSVCSFDITEEGQRQEPWIGDPDTTAENLYNFLVGGRFSINNKNINYENGNGGFLGEYKNAKFIEVIDEVNEVVDHNSDTNSDIDETTKVIYYILFKEG